jgi:DNA polymerase I-like protein with 3'-5' exonuclease and polymerase domains
MDHRDTEEESAHLSHTGFIHISLGHQEKEKAEGKNTNLSKRSENTKGTKFVAGLLIVGSTLWAPTFYAQSQDVKQDRQTSDRIEMISEALVITQSVGFNVDEKILLNFQKKYQDKLDSLKKSMLGREEVLIFNGNKGTFNPLFPEDLATVLRDILRIPKIKDTETIGYSTDDEVLTRIAKKG